MRLGRVNRPVRPRELRVSAQARAPISRVSRFAKYRFTTFSRFAKYLGVARKPAPKTEDAYEAVFTALVHPVRRRILHTLNFKSGAMSAGDIAAMFSHAWPTTTRHLQVLEAAGLVVQERQGRARIYRIDKQRLALARDWISWFFKPPG